MLRTYANKGSVKPIDFGKLLGAVKMVKVEKKSNRAAAASYHLSQTTFNRYMRKLNLKFTNFAQATDEELLAFLKESSTSGAKPVFTDIQEKALMEYITKCSKNNNGLTIINIRTLVFEFAKKCGVNYPPGWNQQGKASTDWYYVFKKRHPNLSVFDNNKQTKTKATPSPRKGINTVPLPKQPDKDEEDRNFCMICMQLLPKKLNRNNSIHCNKCNRPYHLKCVNMGNRGFYTCEECDSDLDTSDK